MSRDLTTTSYAILGLLAIKPWTTYELAQQMERAFRLFWPRAQSKVYEEPKKLVEYGLATARLDAVGRRRRTIYSITGEGRLALSTWLKDPGEAPVLEFEQYVKVFFAEFGTKEDALRTLDAARAWARARIAEHAGVARSYLDGEGPFPQRLAIHSLGGRFLSDFAVMLDAWAAWAADTVRGWPDDIASAEPDLAALREVARRGPRF